MHDRLPQRGCVQSHLTSLDFRGISDNISETSETVYNRDTLAAGIIRPTAVRVDGSSVQV